MQSRGLRVGFLVIAVKYTVLSYFVWRYYFNRKVRDSGTTSNDDCCERNVRNGENEGQRGGFS